MLTSLSLRLRIFLLFAGAWVAFSGLVAGALYFGFMRVADVGVTEGFIFAGVISVFGLLAISACIWLLFDENVAKPIERLASAMRIRAHSGVDASVDVHQARYLGDLGPAAAAVSEVLSKSTAEGAGLSESEVARINAERSQLAELLTKIPIAIVLVGPSNKIMLYDGQAAEILGQIHVPRLNASIFDYFSEQELSAALGQLTENRVEVAAEIGGARGNFVFNVHLKKLDHSAGFMMLIDDVQATIDAAAERPLIFDFDLSQHPNDVAFENMPLKNLTFVVFDTETTGLMPNKDEIIQIGAVRVVNGRIVPGESMDVLINPGRRIPPASTKVHGITDAMVKDAIDPPTAVSQFHAFAQDSVIVAHNAPFDMAFLKRHSQASGEVWDHPVLDTVLLSAILFGTNEVHTLDALCERLNIEIPAEVRHTGLGDAVATARAFCAMLPVLSSRGFDTFGAVVQETRKLGRLLKDLN